MHLQEFLGRGDEAAVAHNRLQDDSGNLVLVGLKRLPHAVQVIVCCRQCGSCSTMSTIVP